MQRRLRVAVLASGRGSNLAALIRAAGSGELAIDLVGVWSDRRAAAALDLARAAEVPARALNPRDFPDRPSFDAALFAEVEAAGPELIVCAGFMRVLSAAVVAAHTEHLINIHPSLLPRHQGLDTHARVLAAGEREHGASVHFVIPALDAGPVIATTQIDVAPEDDAKSLAQRLLPAEHALLVASVALFTRHRLHHRDGRVYIDGRPLTAPLRMIEGRLQPA